MSDPGWGYDRGMGLFLPPTAAPSTPAASRENMAAAVRDDLRQLLVDVCNPMDKVGHALAVAGGGILWRQVFVKEYGALYDGNRAQADHLADVLFTYICWSWRRQYGTEGAGAFLDAVHVPSPRSEKEIEAEIEDAWTVDIASSNEAMEKFYVGSARHRTGADAFNSFWNKPQDEK